MYAPLEKRILKIHGRVTQGLLTLEQALVYLRKYLKKKNLNDANFTEVLKLFWKPS